MLDEQELERLDVLLKEALQDQFTIRIVYYENRRLHSLEGKISTRDKKLLLDDKPLILDNIIDIKLL